MMRQVRNQLLNVRELHPYTIPLSVLNHIQLPQSSFPPPTVEAIVAWSPGKRSSLNPAVGRVPIIVFGIPSSLYLD